MKVFLWMETDTMQAGKCLVAWPYIHRPLELGELDLKTFGMVLRLRWLWLSQMDSTTFGQLWQCR
jgi:hypothetical protein